MADDSATTPLGGGDGQRAGEGFRPVESQADLDRIIGERLARERAKFSDYDELKDKAARFDQASEASKSEAQKLLERAEAAEAKAAAFEARERRAAWAAEVAKDAPDLAPLLRGDTEDELRAHYEQLVTVLKTQTRPRRTSVPLGTPTGQDAGSKAVAALRELRRTES